MTKAVSTLPTFLRQSLFLLPFGWMDNSSLTKPSLVPFEKTSPFLTALSAENPDICLPIPIVKDFVDICFDFTNVMITSQQISGCVAVAFEVLDITVASFDLGCFNLPVLHAQQAKLAQQFYKKRIANTVN